MSVNPGEPVRIAVATFLDSIRDRWDLRWVHPEALHITLRFLGELPGNCRPELKEALREASRQQEAFQVGIGSVGLFPYRGRARVLFLQIVDRGELSVLVKRLDAQLGPRFPGGGTTGDYRAHMTLGRVRRGGRTVRAEELNALQIPAFPSFPVDHFALLESHLTTSGPIYKKLDVFPLAAIRRT